MSRTSQVESAHELVALAELDPFDPPRDYQFEPEFSGPAPRPIPEELRRAQAQSYRRRAVVCGTIGGMLFLASSLPFVRNTAPFIPALAYLHWAGYFFAAIGLLFELRSFWPRVPNQQFLQYGTPTIARICSLWLQPRRLQHGSPITFEFGAMIEYLDEDGIPQVCHVASREIPALKKDRLDTRYRVGQYATALRLSGHGAEEQINLCGFLDLKPGEGIVDFDGAKGRSLPELVAVVVGVFALVGMFAWIFYCGARFEPIHHVPFHDLWSAYTIGSLMALVSAYLVASYWSKVETRGRDARNARAITTGGPCELSLADIDRKWWTFKTSFVPTLLATSLLGLLFCNMAVVFSYWAVNAVLDKSPGVRVPVEIADFIVKEQRVNGLPLYGSYIVKFRLPGDRRVHSISSTPEHMDRFVEDVGIANVREGYFGWKWVDDVSPRPVKAPARAKQ